MAIAWYCLRCRSFQTPNNALRCEYCGSHLIRANKKFEPRKRKHWVKI